MKSVHHFLTRLDTTEPIRLLSRKLEFLPSSEPLPARAKEAEYKFFVGVSQMGLDDISILSSLLQQSRGQPLPEGEYSSGAATNQEKHLMELLDGIEILSSISLKKCFRENVQNFLLEYHKFNSAIHLCCDIYKDLSFLYGDLQFLLAYLGDSWDIDEGQLKCVKEVSDKAKHVIEESIVHSGIQRALERMSNELMNGVQVDPLDLFRHLQKPIDDLQFICRFLETSGELMNEVQVDLLDLFKNMQKCIRIHDFQCILGCLECSRKEINCIKAEILATSSKHRYINDQLSNPKLPQRDSKQETLVAFGDEELFLERLTSNSTQPGLQILTIVGMGGIGKTTLAKQLFNHPYVVYHFDCLAWITFSQGYDMRDLLLVLLNSLAHKSDKLIEKTDAQLAESVYKSLKCKRYLIVMDDMWATKAWNDVKRCFPDDKTGSQILITSRVVGLANHVSPNKLPHFMNLFDAEQSWELLQKLVFKNAVCSSQLEEVGRHIAKRCCGLPLVIVVIAGVLCSTPLTLESWSEIAENLSSTVFKDPEQCLDILALSYVYLPCRLRACFMYMGAFPDDCEIDVQKLINLWVAEGFLHFECQGNLEQIAENCLEDLIGRNLVMVGKRKPCGKVKTCRLHDFVKELCLREAKKEGFMNVIGRQISKNIPAGQRRLSFHLDPFCDASAPPALPGMRSH